MIALFLGIVALLVIAAIGFPLGFALLFVGTVGFALVHPGGFEAAANTGAIQIMDLVTRPEFAVLPLFMLMGVFVTRSGIADDVYDTASKWLGHFRGGLALSTVAACGGMAAISGSSMATAATMTKVAIPAMRRY